MKKAAICWLAILGSLLLVIEYASCQTSTSVVASVPGMTASVNATIMRHSTVTGNTTMHVSPTATANNTATATTNGSSVVSTVKPSVPTSVTTTKAASKTATKTLTPVPTHSSVAPTSPTTAKPKGPEESHERHFDTASFFGGIILASGLIICGYFIWRFYKSRRSYHHL